MLGFACRSEGRGGPRLRHPDRHQRLLGAIDLERLPPDHRARLVWAFVDGLDCATRYARIRAVEGHVTGADGSQHWVERARLRPRTSDAQAGVEGAVAADACEDKVEAEERGGKPGPRQEPSRREPKVDGEEGEQASAKDPDDPFDRTEAPREVGTLEDMLEPLS